MKSKYLFRVILLTLSITCGFDAQALDIKGIHIGDSMDVVKQRVDGIICAESPSQTGWQLCEAYVSYAGNQAYLQVRINNGVVSDARVIFDMVFYVFALDALSAKIGSPSSNYDDAAIWAQDGVGLVLNKFTRRKKNPDDSSTDPSNLEDDLERSTVMLLRLPDMAPTVSQ